MSKCQVFTEQEIADFRHAGKILSQCLDLMRTLVKAGVTTKELDRKAEEFIRSFPEALPAFQGYHSYPATICTSVNEQCVHGIPGERELKEGDIVSVDCGVLYHGLYTDACRTFPVGEIDAEAKHLLAVTENALEEAVKVIHAGARVGDISSKVEQVVEDGGCSVVSALTGHGVGRDLHQFPDIPNYGSKGAGPLLPAGTVIAVEPIVCAGKDGIAEADDGWTISTKDGSLSAHFEHTILVTEEGCEVLA